MKKNLMMSAVIGAVALGAGAFALNSLGAGSDAAPVSPRVAHAAPDTGSWHDPFVFVSEDVLDRIDIVPAAYQPGATLFPEVPATGDDPADQAISDDPKHDGNDTPATPQAGGAEDPESADTGDAPVVPIDVPTTSDTAGKPPVIFNPKVNDAICTALHCDEPELPYNPEITDDICQALDCDDAGDAPINPQVDPCDLLGCPTPKLPAQPGKIIDVLRRL
jgi:hypothetical protein